MNQEEDDTSFTVKYWGNNNPLTIKLPQNLWKGSKYIQFEVGSFFWNRRATCTAATQGNNLPVAIKIPGTPTGNYDILGNPIDSTTIVMADDYSINTGMGSTAYVLEYHYSPGRPDLFLISPTTMLTVQFHDENGTLITFGTSNYYASFNISY